MLAQLRCLRAAALTLGFDVDSHDREGNLLTVYQGDVGISWLFSLSRTPFNTESQAALCMDKAHFHAVVSPHVRMPATCAFLDPGTDPEYRHYVLEAETRTMADRAARSLGYPMVVKPNSGSLGRGVRLCRDAAEVREALEAVFDQRSRFYDYVGIAQQFVPLRCEYRVVCHRGEPLFAYERNGGRDGFMARYWETGGCKRVEDTGLLERLGAFVRPVFERTGLGFAGFDVGVSAGTGSGDDDPEEEGWMLFEANSKPYFTHIIEAGEVQAVTAMYEQLLTREMEFAKTN
ncbi:MAG: ATP-grasp domain-containing protein [Gammaproteobacteria bacterium]